MTIQLRRHDRSAALEALRQGDYEAITTSSQGALDELVHLAIELGVFEALEVLEVQRQRAGIPDALLLRVLAILPFVEAIGLSAAGGYLLQDAATLLQIGFTIQQLQEGFHRRHHGDQGKRAISKPCHPEVLRRELARIDPFSLARVRRALTRQLFERGLVQGKVYAIDGTGLSDRYLLVGILNVHKDRALWLNWRLLQGDASEKGQEAHIVRGMVDEIVAAGGAGAMEWLLMDALYADGPLLAWLEYEKGIHGLVRVPEDRVLYQDMQGLVSGDLVGWEPHTDVR
jgi:hypothetical protein